MNSEGKIRDFTDLNAWKEAHKLALATYQETERFPHTERFSLVDQMRRATVSITSNIAEGFSRNSREEKIQFFSIAQGSVTELQNQLILSKDLRYIPPTSFEKVFNQSVIVHKLLNGLIKATRIMQDHSHNS